METLKQHHDSPLEDVSAADTIEAAVSRRPWESKHVTMPRFGPVRTDRRPRASAKAGPCLPRGTPCNGVYVLVCPAGLASRAELGLTYGLSSPLGALDP